MATALYDTGRNAFLNAGINWGTDTISAVLVHNSTGGTSYTPVLSTDQFFSIIPAGAIIAGPVNTASNTSAAGVANCANVVFTSVAGGAGRQVDAVVFYKNTGTAGTSQLICYIDSTNTATLPVVPNGSNITVQIDSGVNHLFKL